MKAKIGFWLLLTIGLAAMPFTEVSARVLIPRGLEKVTINPDSPMVHYHGFPQSRSQRDLLNLKRDTPWGLPKVAAAAANGIDTLYLLGLRFDFEYEIPDDENTTGRGRYDMRDTSTFFTEEGHQIDPSPHTRQYFEKHFEALDRYYRYVSEGRLTLVWDVWPKQDDSVYHLPNKLSHYGQGSTIDEIVTRLVDSFFIDCFRLVDTSEPGITFSDYDSYFLFHAGSDRQNDIGFPPTTSDLFTGYATRGDDREPLYVDDGTHLVSDALIMPETASQDNRATALNAVMAHEFGHQLGLVDLYRTDNFFTQLGDFALMDNNGFGTGIDFGFEVGRAFGTMPVYPMAWSRAFLGFNEPAVYRQNADVELVAAEMLKEGIKIARIPITEQEYYLVENRQIEVDGLPTALLADSVTGVIQGPIYYNELTQAKTFSGEYDFLLPGSGILVWHVDESVAAQKYPGSDYTLFEVNRLQLNPRRRFIELMEADGLVNFGGNYYAGYGAAEDMYYAENNTSFTPNTNPPSIGYTGANSRIYVTDISSSDTTMSFGLEYDNLSAGFPRRAGYPSLGISPVAADVDGDGKTEILAVSDRNLLLIREDGGDPFPFVPMYYDTSFGSTGNSVDSVPLLGRLPLTISAGPVVGNFGSDNDSQFVAVAAFDTVYIHTLHDDDFDGRGDIWAHGKIALPSLVAWMSFGPTLDAAVVFSNAVRLYSIAGDGDTLGYHAIEEAVPHGFARLGNDAFVALAGDTAESYTKLYYVDRENAFPLELNDYYNFGPVVVDLDRDHLPEIVMATPFGTVRIITIDTLSDPIQFSASRVYQLYDTITVNPVVADIDEDGYADIITCGRNKIYAMNRGFTSLTNFPVTIDIRYPGAIVISTPVVADIDGDQEQDIIFVTNAGNCYAFDSDPAFGFPLAVGGLSANAVLLPGYDFGEPVFKDIALYGLGSVVVYPRESGGGLGFLGGDGWFYAYDILYDTAHADWPMYGGDASGTFNLPGSRLGIPAAQESFPPDEFFCYPNPTVTGRTTIRYFLGQAAEIDLKIFDMSGRLMLERRLNGQGGIANEFDWNGSSLPSGVYRCIIEADFGGFSRSAFTDIAIAR